MMRGDKRPRVRKCRARALHAESSAVVLKWWLHVSGGFVDFRPHDLADPLMKTPYSTVFDDFKLRWMRDVFPGTRHGFPYTDGSVWM